MHKRAGAGRRPGSVSFWSGIREELSGGTDVTDGWNARPLPPPANGQPLPPAGGPPQPGSPWWSDALADPWRDPYAPTAVVLQPAASSGPPPEAVPDPDAPRRSYAPILLICL